MKYKKQLLFFLEFFFKSLLIFVYSYMAYLKFSSDVESIFIFSKLEMEFLGRFIIGGIEAGIVFLLLTKKFFKYGLVLSFGIVLGTLIAHMTVLGWTTNIEEKYNVLFFLLICIPTISLMFLKRKLLPLIGKSLT